MKIPKEIKDNTKGRNCSISGCKKSSKRSFPEKEYENNILKAGLKYIKNKQKRIFLCREHMSISKNKSKNSKKDGFLGFVSSMRW